MKMQKLIAALCLISLILAIAPAAGETVDLGPAKISMDLGSMGSHTIEKGNASPFYTNRW